MLIGSPTEYPDRTAGPPGTITISGLVAPPQTLPSWSCSVIPRSTPLRWEVFTDTGSNNYDSGHCGAQQSDHPCDDLGCRSPGTGGRHCPERQHLAGEREPDGTPITGANRVFSTAPAGGLTARQDRWGPSPFQPLALSSHGRGRVVALYNAQMSTAVEGGTEALPPGTITITAETMTMSGRTPDFAFTASPAPVGNIALTSTHCGRTNPDGTFINDSHDHSLASVGVGEDSVSGREEP